VVLGWGGQAPLHLDISAPDRAHEQGHLVSLGDSIVQEFEHHTWMRDPEGNDFCLTDAKPLSVAGLCRVDSSLERRHPVTRVPRLQALVFPVVAGHHATAVRRSAPTYHPEARRSRLRSIVDRRFLSRCHRPSRRDLVRADVPQSRVTAVVPEVGRCVRRQHQVLVLIDRDRVDERGIGISVRLCDENVEFGRRDQFPTEFDDDGVGNDLRREEQAVALDERFRDDDSLVNPYVTTRWRSHEQSLSHDRQVWAGGAGCGFE